MVETLSQTLSWCVAGLRFDDLSKDVVADARLRILDTLAVMLAATASPIALAVRRTARAPGSGHGAQIVGTDGFTTANLAALVHGTAGRTLDFDDTDNALVMPRIEPLFDEGGMSKNLSSTASGVGSI